VGVAYDAQGNITQMRHDDVVNAFFVDGHVKAMKPSSSERSSDTNSPWTGRYRNDIADEARARGHQTVSTPTWVRHTYGAG